MLKTSSRHILKTSWRPTIVCWAGFCFATQNLGKTFRELFQINTAEVNSPQRMRLTQYQAVLHHCLRCQRGTGFGPKYLLQDVSKLLILSNFFNFSRNKGLFSALLRWLSRKLRHLLPTKKVYLLIYLICKELNFSI